MLKTLPFSHTLQAVLVSTAAVALAGSASVGAQGAEPTGAAVRQERPARTWCEMSFTMKGWSAIVSKASGQGVVTCDNGQRANVTLEIKGGGLTFGKTRIDEGKGMFSQVADIADIFGSYAQAEASAGAVESVDARVLTKGEVSLTVTSKGRGWNVGVSGAKFSIERAPAE
jgi:hypothetical protein